MLIRLPVRVEPERGELGEDALLEVAAGDRARPRPERSTKLHPRAETLVLRHEQPKDVRLFHASDIRSCVGEPRISRKRGVARVAVLALARDLLGPVVRDAEPGL